MHKQIPYGRQDITQADISAVVEVLQSDWLTQGPNVERFEETVAAYCGAKYGVATSNATAALHLACLALDLGPGIVFGPLRIPLLLPPTVGCTAVRRWTSLILTRRPTTSPSRL